MRIRSRFQLHISDTSIVRLVFRAFLLPVRHFTAVQQRQLQRSDFRQGFTGYSL